MRRPLAAALAGLGLAALLVSGCISYSVRSSSSASSSGYGSGSGGGGGSTSGTGPGVSYPSEQAPGHDVYGGAPVPGAGGANLAWDPALGVYRVTSEPGTYYDGHAFYRKGEYGWVARVGPQQPWRQITHEALPPGLRDR